MLSYVCILLWFSSLVHGFFVFTQPNKDTQWINNSTNLVSWTKGSRDGVYTVDIELSRLSSGGLIRVALNVPTSRLDTLNMFIVDVPPGNDYHLHFVNSTHGIIYASSDQFSILPASATSTASPQPSPNPKAATVTVSGGPDPTKVFGTTFPVDPNLPKSGALGSRSSGWVGIFETRLKFCAFTLSVALGAASMVFLHLL